VLTVQRACTSRSEVDLIVAQVTAIDEWNSAMHMSAVADHGALSREGRLDLDCRLAARRRVQQAVIDHAARQMRSAGGPLCSVPALRAIVAHRQQWLRDKVAEQLSARGITVVGLVDDGADAVGMAVVEQPDLVLVEARLPSLSGTDVVARVRRFSPRTIVGCQVIDGGEVDQLLRAGAHGVFTRRIPPMDIADHLLQCLTGDEPSVVAI
jgi:CheY-like chemotaxis protein